MERSTDPSDAFDESFESHPLLSGGSWVAIDLTGEDLTPAVDDLLAALPALRSRRSQILIALEEARGNVARHAKHDCIGRSFVHVATPDRPGLEFLFTDSGRGFRVEGAVPPYPASMIGREFEFRRTLDGAVVCRVVDAEMLEILFRRNADPDSIPAAEDIPIGGLGLSIMAKVMDRVAYLSHLGGCNALWMTLNVTASPDRAGDSIKETSVRMSTPSARVMLVDDDPNILMLLEFTFRQQGYDTVVAENGAAALEALEAATPDLIVTDVMMPVMSGHELCAKVRSDPRWQTLPFIFLSARGSTDDRIAGLDLGADDYVVKPFDRRELLAKARTMLNRVRIYRDQIPTGAHDADEQDGAKAVEQEAVVSDTAPHILVVDDEEPMRRLIEFNLRKAQFRVSIASNGREALDLAAETTPDLIISDVMLPEMDGIQLRRELLGRDALNTIPFLFLTAKGQPDDVMAGPSLGADDYVTKPVNPQVLVQKTRNLLARNRASADRYRRELQQAASRVSTQLEPDVPRIDGMTISQRCEPLEVRGGDYYDYLELEDGTIAFALGDVMGKKWGAWFFSVAYIAYLRSVIRSTTHDSASPASIVRHVNRLLWEDLKISEVFTTLIFGIVDPSTRTVTYANAGHPPAIHYRATGNVARLDHRGGLILGVEPDQAYEEISVLLEPGDALVFYTDGLTEARDPHGDLFGDDRLVDAVRDSASAGGDAIADRLFDAVRTFAAETRVEDDCTVMVIRTDA